MRNNIFIKNPSGIAQRASQEKGVSLIITFFILTIILAIVLNISALLYSGIKITRNIGNSVLAFYAADSGVEKLLYYDRKRIPVDGKRGLCYMFDLNNPNICPDCTPGTNGDAGDCVEKHCQAGQVSGSDCNPPTCGDCEISFNTFFDGKTYRATARIAPRGDINDNVFDTNIDIRGNYKDVLRKVQLKIINR